MSESVWHIKSPEEIFKQLDTNERGLSSTEAKQRLERDGKNMLPESKRDGIVLIFLRQFQNPLIYILIGAAGIVFFLGEAVDAGIIFAVLLINALVGAIQEGRAQDTLLALKKFVNTTAVAVRDGIEVVVPDNEIVAGDIVLLQSGGKVPADARVIEVKNLKIDEAALTGESEPVTKFGGPMGNVNDPILEQKNMVFKGTNVSSGEGRAVVVAVGVDTAIGRIAKQISSIETEIPLKANIRNLSHLIIGVTFVMSIVLFFAGIHTGKTALEMFVTVVSVAVSVIPEGLPIAVTLILATGVWRMSKRNALVKRLQAVEALGQAEVIAVDKTGTITKNEMVIREIYAGGKNFEISGVGYEPKGEVLVEGSSINPPDYPALMYAGRIASFCANARTTFNPEDKSWRVSGDPTEAAMYVLGQKLGFDKDSLERESPVLAEIPFEYKLKYHTMVHEDKGRKLMTVVGAPETILKLCTKVWREDGEQPFSKEEHSALEEKYLEFSRKGLRVLAFATTEDIPEPLSPESIKSLAFVGFYGMQDALREEVKDATRRAQNAGIKVVMITGDHKVTAEALAREALIHKEGDLVLSGEDVEKMSEEELMKALSKVSVFARVTPEHKLRVIKAYKSLGKIVAMTGDGVNDAPSLVAADLGVGMGRIGTEVAKEASDIILLDDNFGSIVSAIEEGRNIYRSIRKVVLYLLSTGLGELLVITGAIFLGFPLPLLPAQIIWLNLVTDGFFTAALAMEPKEKDLLERTFEKPKKYLVDAHMARRMVLMSLPMMVGTLILFNEYFRTDIAKAWTVSLTLLAVFQWFNAWNARSDKNSAFSSPFSNKYLVGAAFGAVVFQLLAVYHPLFQKFLRTVPLGLSDWLVIVSFASSIILVEEARKWIARRNTKSLPSLAPQLQASQS